MICTKFPGRGCVCTELLNTEAEFLCSCYWSWSKRIQLPARNHLVVVQECSIPALLRSAPCCRHEAPVLWPVSWLPRALLTICQHSSIVVCCVSAKQVPWPPHQPAALLQEGKGLECRPAALPTAGQQGKELKKLGCLPAKSTGRNYLSPAFSASPLLLLSFNAF